MKQTLNIKMVVTCLCGEKATFEAGSEMMEDAKAFLCSFINTHQGHKKTKHRIRHTRYREVWTAYRPGEDVAFKDAWVCRDEKGAGVAVMNSEKELRSAAKVYGAKIRWQTRK